MIVQIVQIALGIVLAVLILAFLPELIALGIAGLLVASGLVVLVGFVIWFPNAFVFGVPLVVNLFAIWNAYRNAKKHDKKDAQDLQQGQGKSETGLTWLETVSDAERKKQAFSGWLILVGLPLLLISVGLQMDWPKLVVPASLLLLPVGIYLSLYGSLRRMNRCYATRKSKVLFRTANVATSEAIKEGSQRGWT